MFWYRMETAPRDGTHFTGRRGSTWRETWWGKTSHVPLYGWCYLATPGDIETCELWEPAMWSTDKDSPQ